MENKSREISQQRSILVVDDETDSLTALCDILSEWGYKVVGYTTGKDSLEALKKQSFDLIISDLVMPEMDGIALLKEARVIAPAIVSIIITGKGTIQAAVEAMKFGAFDFVLKPFDFKILKLIVSRAIEVSQLRLLQETYRSIVEDYQTELICRFLVDGTLTFVNKAFCNYYKKSREELIGQNLMKFIYEGDIDKVRRIHEILSQKNLIATDQYRVMKQKDEIRWQRWVYRAIFNEDDHLIEIQAIGSDITELKKTGEELKKKEEQIQHQLKRFAALYNIEMAITGSLDLRVILRVILGEIIDQLGVDAADILLLKPNTQILDYVAGRGFRTNALQHTHLRVGEGHAGLAALEQRIICIPNLSESANGFSRSKLLPSEEFVSYYAVPLISKGFIKGVLEVFHRAPLEVEQEWMEFLEAISTHTAIAIDNATLFNDLRRSNIELALAYDATIEGWSRALDYRDKETEGHSQRVTDSTLKIARNMGVSEEELVHVRRGALLHDIGKLGVPDAVLFKPDKLNNEEWAIMKRHPIIAYELLSPIPYLRAALDIPYCHHEKWDGTGYPRGLKYAEIPRAARIFSLVDVWDALSSDRPYRTAWPKEKTHEYISEQSGKHFDPEVIEAFLKIIT